MEWLRENFFWLVVGALFVWMHLKMHGGSGHGGHGGHGGCGGGRGDPRENSPGERANDKEGHDAEH